MTRRYYSSWEEIMSLKDKNPSLDSLLRIVRLSAHSGTTFAKNRGFEEVLSQSNDPQHHAVVFLDAHCIVSPHWLVPLASTLSRYPKALVYPTLDTLTVSANEDGSEQVGIVRAEDGLVAAFDWALQPRWEPLNPTTSARRVQVAAGTTEAEAVEAMSPAAPGVFAVTASYLKELGRFDASLYGTSYSPSEAIELSLRTWLCGGVVLKARCSRVAHQASNLFGDAPVGYGVTQASVDETALNLAQKWMQGTTNVITNTNRNTKATSGETVSYQELTFRARFLNRVPYGVELSNDPILISPAQSILTASMSHGSAAHTSKLQVCLPFHWYLHEVYPGLLLDAPSVLTQFASYLQTDYLGQQAPLTQLVAEYNKPLEQQKPISVQTGLLNVRASKLAQFASIAIGAGTAVNPASDFKIKRFFPEPIGLKPQTRQEKLFEHSNQVQSTLKCIDFPEKVYSDSCEARLASDPQLCSERKADVLFQCPKTCGFCAKEDGLFCEDFYLNKCECVVYASVVLCVFTLSGCLQTCKVCHVPFIPV